MSDTAEALDQSNTGQHMDGTVDQPNTGDVTIDNPAKPVVEDWKSPFGDAKTLETFKSPEDFIKSYDEAQGMIRNSIRIPTEDASDEVKNAFYEKLTAIDGVVRMPTDDASKASFNSMMGVPEKADGYRFSDIDGYQGDAQADLNLGTLAHSLGLSNEQANGLREHLIKNDMTSSKASAESVQKGLDDLYAE